MPENTVQSVDVLALKEIARNIRLDILEMTTRASPGHTSSSWSPTDILVALFFGGVLRYGPISREMGLEPLVDKWQSFGLYVVEADGHDMDDLLAKLEEVKAVQDQPAIIIAHTIKGKGVSFVEADYTFHGRALNQEQAILAREELNATW
jgi:transketolase